MITINKLKGKIPKDFLQVFTFDVVSKLLLGIISIILIRNFNTQEYAEYTKFSTLSNFIVGVFGTGISLSFVRYSTEMISRDKRAPVSNLYFLSSLLLFVVFILSLSSIQLLGKVYGTTTSIILSALGYGFLMSLNRLNQFYYQAKELFVKAGVVGNLRNIILFILIIFFVSITRSLTFNNILIMFIISATLSFIFGSIRIYQNVKWSSVLTNLHVFKEMLGEGTWLIIYSSILNTFNQMDVLMLSNMTSESVLADYGVAFRYYGILLTVLPSIQAVLRIRTSKKEYVDSSNKRSGFTTNWIKKMYKVVIIVCIGLIILSDLYMPILNGSQYDAAIPVYKVFVIGVGMSYLFAPNVSIMMSGKKHKILCLLASLSLIINIVGNYLMIPLFGAIGAAISTVLSQGFLNIASTLIVLRVSRRDQDINDN